MLFLVFQPVHLSWVFRKHHISTYLDHSNQSVYPFVHPLLRSSSQSFFMFLYGLEAALPKFGFIEDFHALHLEIRQH
jgi:hypothetical protein